MTRSEPYHHANLRQTLLDAAVTLIGEVGPRAFTLREVARKAGVSHNAPYRHFVSKDELLAEVAAEGFDRLAASMRKSIARATSPSERLQKCGCGYVAFALRWPQHFLVMFDLPQAPHGDKKHQAAGQNAFAVLEECIAACAAVRESPGWRSVASGLDCVVAGSRHRQTRDQRQSSSQRPLYHRIYPQRLPENLRRNEGRTVRLLSAEENPLRPNSGCRSAWLNDGKSRNWRNPRY